MDAEVIGDYPTRRLELGTGWCISVAGTLAFCQGFDHPVWLLVLSLLSAWNFFTAWSKPMCFERISWIRSTVASLVVGLFMLQLINPFPEPYPSWWIPLVGLWALLVGFGERSMGFSRIWLGLVGYMVLLPVLYLSGSETAFVLKGTWTEAVGFLLVFELLRSMPGSGGRVNSVVYYLVSLSLVFSLFIFGDPSLLAWGLLGWMGVAFLLLGFCGAYGAGSLTHFFNSLSDAKPGKPLELRAVVPLFVLCAVALLVLVDPLGRAWLDFRRQLSFFEETQVEVESEQTIVQERVTVETAGVVAAQQEEVSVAESPRRGDVEGVSSREVVHEGAAPASTTRELRVENGQLDERVNTIRDDPDSVNMILRDEIPDDVSVVSSEKDEQNEGRSSEPFEKSTKEVKSPGLKFSPELVQTEDSQVEPIYGLDDFNTREIQRDASFNSVALDIDPLDDYTASLDALDGILGEGEGFHEEDAAIEDEEPNEDMEAFAAVEQESDSAFFQGQSFEMAARKDEGFQDEGSGDAITIGGEAVAGETIIHNVGPSSELGFHDSIRVNLHENILCYVRLKGRGSVPPMIYLRRMAVDTIRGSEFVPHDPQRFPVEHLQLEDGGLVSDVGGFVDWEITSIERSDPYFFIPEVFSRLRLPRGMQVGYDPLNLQIYGQPQVGEQVYVFEGVRRRAAASLKKVWPEDAVMRDEYRNYLLELPLSDEDREYLELLLHSIVGDFSSLDEFNRKLGRYIYKNHPYRYDFRIPDGPEHIMVRWLKGRSPGICGYYAGAYVLLARTAGIPCRVVLGVRSDEYDLDEKCFVVRAQYSHAWVEVLNKYDRWIRVDPTDWSVYEADESQALAMEVEPFEQSDKVLEEESESVEQILQENEVAMEELGEEAMEDSSGLDEMLAQLQSVSEQQSDDVSMESAEVAVHEETESSIATAEELHEQGLEESSESLVMLLGKEERKDVEPSPEPLLEEAQATAEEEASVPKLASSIPDALIKDKGGWMVFGPRMGFSNSLSLNWLVWSVLATALILMLVMLRFSVRKEDSPVRRQRRPEGHLLAELERWMHFNPSLVDDEVLSLWDELQRLRYGPNADLSRLGRLKKQFSRLRKQANSKA